MPIGYKYLGDKFGNITFIKHLKVGYYQCLCDCGHIFSAFPKNLIKNNYIECFECRKQRKFVSLPPKTPRYTEE